MTPGLLAATSTQGPSFTVGGWVAWTIVAGAVAGSLTAIWGFWHKVVAPVVAKIDTLNDIAHDFRPNGTSLREIIGRIEARLAELTRDPGTRTRSTDP